MKKCVLSGIILLILAQILFSVEFKSFSTKNCSDGDLTLNLLYQDGLVRGHIIGHENGLISPFRAEKLGRKYNIIHSGKISLTHLRDNLMRTAIKGKRINNDGMSCFKAYESTLDYCEFNYISDTLHLDRWNNNSPSLSVFVVYPKFEDNYLNIALAANMFPGSETMLLKKAAAHYSTSLQKNYINSLKDIYDQDVAAGRQNAVFNWVYEDISEIIYKDKHRLVIMISHYECTGGAHGNHREKYLIWDLKNQKIISFDDVFIKGSNLLIKKHLDEAVINQYSVDQPEEILFSEDYPVSKNISLMNNGVLFHYDPYDIASYAMGSIDLFVSYEKLSSIMKFRL